MAFRRKLVLALAALAAITLPVAAGAMKSTIGSARTAQAEATAQFEVASVRVNKSGELGMRSSTKGRLYSAANTWLRHVIAAAYRIPAARIVDGPSWIGAASIDMRFVGGDRFDISATLPEGSSSEQVPAMLRSLLADRFKLVAHSESRESSIYGLVVARADGRLGPKLRKSPIDCEASSTRPDPLGGAIPISQPANGSGCESEIGAEVHGRGQRLSALARMLSLFTDRPVIDKTGLTGGYDFDLQFPELNANTLETTPRVEPMSGIFPALQDQLGLKLESAKGSLEFLVIDRIDRPQEN